MPDQIALREALVDLVADIEAGDVLRRRIERRGRSRRPLTLLVAAAVVLVALVATALALTHDEPAPVTTVPGEGWAPLAPAPLGPRLGASVAWTGHELLVWGGAYADRVAMADGAAYDAEADRWRPMATAPIDGRFDAVSAWTGTELLVWGGSSGTAHPASGGAAYDPATDSWRRLPPAPIEDRADAVGVWTGNELVVFGGGDAEIWNDGAAYDPATDRWRPIGPAPVDVPINGSAAWTGQEVVLHTDGRTVLYDPAADRWRTLPVAPFDRAGTIARLAGNRLVVWGGYERDGRSTLGTTGPWQEGGAVLDLQSGEWKVMSEPPAPTGPIREGGAVVLSDAVVLAPAGLVYWPATDTWEQLPPSGLDVVDPVAMAAIGSKLLVWADGPLPDLPVDGADLASRPVPGATVPVRQRPANTDDAVDCGRPEDLVPTWLPAGWSRELASGDGGGGGARDVLGHWGAGAFVDLATGTGGIPLTGTEPIQVHGRIAVLGDIHEGYGVLACGISLRAYGISRDDLRRFATGLVGRDEPFAIWPEAAPSELPTELPAWRADAVETARRFATDVLGWQRPQLVANPHGATTYDLTTDGSAVVRVDVRKVVGQGWSVTRVDIGGTDPFAHIRVGDEGAGVRLDVEDPAFAVANVTFLGPGRSQSLEGVPRVDVATSGSGWSTEQPGAVLVLLRDGDGNVVGAWGRALPAGAYPPG